MNGSFSPVATAPLLRALREGVTLNERPAPAAQPAVRQLLRSQLLALFDDEPTGHRPSNKLS